MLNGHKKHAYLPTDVRSIMQNELLHAFLGTKLSIRGVDEDHVEVCEENELNGSENFSDLLQVIVLLGRLTGDSKVMTNHEKVQGKCVEHND